MERGYQINIERSFDRIVGQSKSQTLLACLNALDRQLERLLSADKADEKAETVKIVSYKHSATMAESGSAPVPKAKNYTTQPPVVPKVNQKPAAPTVARLSEAKATRNAQTRQLEARMGRLPRFSKAEDGLTFTVPIEVRKRDQLPAELQSVQQVKLIVPEEYDISPCSIQLIGASGPAAAAVEKGFKRRAGSMPQATLVNHINYLSQNMQVLADSQAEAENPQKVKHVSAQPAVHVHDSQTEPESSSLPIRSAADASDRPHLVVIPRPPEWDNLEGDGVEESDISSESEDDFETEEEGRVEEDAKTAATAYASAPERGIAISFPHLELHGIELLEVGTLNITVKCERCKDAKDITNVQKTSAGSQPRGDSCKKCAAAFKIGKAT
jgi:hypothetical protein